MDNWENKYLPNRGIHYSRIIASWNNAIGSTIYGDNFKNWLKIEAKLDDEQINEIVNLANDGKLEWEENARRFMGLKD